MSWTSFGPQHCCMTVEVVLPDDVWGTAHQEAFMSAPGRTVATELGLQRPVVFVGLEDIVGFCGRFLTFIVSCEARCVISE